MADLTDELAGLNENARLLLEKYDGVCGSIKQIQYTEFYDRLYLSTYDVTPLFDVKITPKSETSKIKIEIVISIGNSDDTGFSLTRNGEVINNHGFDETYSDPNCFYSVDNYIKEQYVIDTLSFVFFDYPSSTDELTYTVESRAKGGNTADLYINRGSTDTDGSRGASKSSITVTEIGV